jgi:selenoprotein W-related protein
VAGEIKKSAGINAELVPGKGGVFNVTVDGKLIFSKDDVGRFPNPGEVSALLKKP